LGAIRSLAAGGGYAALVIVALGAPGPATAEPVVATGSAVFVETVAPDQSRQLAPAARLSRGDRLVYFVTWTVRQGSGGFTLTNPLPPSVAYQGSANSDEEVSVDGGRSWGKLGTLRIGSDLAAAYDVTHVRWRIAPVVAAKGSGRIAYSAIVR
jgi:hypothetical protein